MDSARKDEAFTGGGQIIFHTLAFAAAISVPTGDADPDAGADAGPPPVMPAMQPVTINFTNVAGDDIASHISVTAGGVPFTAVAVVGGEQLGTGVGRSKKEAEQRAAEAAFAVLRSSAPGTAPAVD